MATEILKKDKLAFESRRSTVYSTGGMVACTQPLAAQAGIFILEQGGNAADAAVTVASCLNVLEPSATGIGGDCFCLYYDASTKTVSGINGSGRSPAHLNLKELVDKGYKDFMSPMDPHTVTVPGAAAAWVDTIEMYGSKKLSLKEVLTPAIRLAKQGFPVSEISSYMWFNNVSKLKSQSPDTCHEMLNLKLEAPKEGERIRLPELAQTFELIANQGKKVFYEGSIAQKIVETLNLRGNKMSLEDLKAHQSEKIEPLYVDYHGYRLHECPPNGQGITCLIALKLLDILEKNGKIPPLSSIAPGSIEYYHILIEVLRIAFADVKFHITDPNFMTISPTDLLSKEYLDKRSECFSMNKANLNIEHGSPMSSSDTVYFSVVDQYGNACSFVNSLFHQFGSGIIPKGTGICLQNRGHGFSLDPTHCNKLEPSKRPYHTILAGMITHVDTGYLFACFGLMGGVMQPQGHLQLLILLTRHQFKPQQALDFPRFCIGSSEQHGHVFFEDHADPLVLEGLKRLGHPVQLLSGHERAMCGRGQIVLSLEKGVQDRETQVLAGGSDPRGDGVALPTFSFT